VKTKEVDGEEESQNEIKIQLLKTPEGKTIHRVL